MKCLSILLCVVAIMTSFDGATFVEAAKKKSKVKTAGKSSKADVKMSEEDLARLGEQRLEEMTNLEAQFPNQVIKFTPKTYRQYVLKNPRPYDVITLFSVQQHCPVCDEVLSEYEQTVYSFVKERGINKDFSKEKKIFFGVLFFQQDVEVQKIFQEHGFTTVPYITASAMNLKRSSAPEKFYEDEDKWHISSQEIYDCQKQIDFVNNHLRTDVQIKFTFASIAFKNFVGLAILASLGLLVKSLYPILMNQLVWFGVAITVFVICTGGLVYSILNNMPWFRFERNEFGAIVVAEYFMRGQRGQYAGEGYIVSFLTTFIGLCILFLWNAEKRFTENKSSYRTAALVSMVVIVFAQQLLMACYRIKSPWYYPTFLPPAYYQKGSLLQD